MRTENEASERDPREVRDKALGLRESVNAARMRMLSQREQLARLRAEITVLRELAALGAAPPPASAVPSPLPVRADAPPLTPAPLYPPPVYPAPVAKEAAADSAPAATSFGTDFGPFSLRAAPYAALLFVAVAVQSRPALRPAAGLPLSAATPAVPKPAPGAPPVAVEEEGAADALLLVHEWRLPGDERTLSERLGDGVELPGAEPAWDAERTGERVYRVSYRPPAGEPTYGFDVDLETRRVDPTPETADLLAPRLTARR